MKRTSSGSGNQVTGSTPSLTLPSSLVCWFHMPFLCILPLFSLLPQLTVTSAAFGKIWKALSSSQFTFWQKSISRIASVLLANCDATEHGKVLHALPICIPTWHQIVLWKSNLTHWSEHCIMKRNWNITLNYLPDEYSTLWTMGRLEEFAPIHLC